MERNEFELVHKESIEIGDAIICKDGRTRTVCKNNIKRNSFTGITIFGDSYMLGHEKVRRVLFPKPWEEKAVKVEEIKKEDFNNLVKISEIYKKYKGYKVSFIETKSNIEVMVKQ